MDKKITVFTPTFNRANVIEKLYKSLKKQTYKNFNWIIVDDGSKDDTKKIVDQWKIENDISILYIYQENSGKMQAHNIGVDNCNTELFVCVDSDDYLIESALEELVRIWDKNRNCNLAGIVAKKGYSKEKQIGSGNFTNKNICTCKELRENGFSGETTLCFNMSILSKFRFPAIENEKFISENYLYDQIDQQYKYIIFPKILTICEYLEDGYTRNMDLISYNNPIGRMYHEAQNMKLASSEIILIKSVIRYNMYKKISGYRDIRKFNVHEKILLFMSYPISLILAYKKKRRVLK